MKLRIDRQRARASREGSIYVLMAFFLFAMASVAYMFLTTNTAIHRENRQAAEQMRGDLVA